MKLTPKAGALRPADSPSSVDTVQACSSALSPIVLGVAEGFELIPGGQGIGAIIFAVDRYRRKHLSG